MKKRLHSKASWKTFVLLPVLLVRDVAAQGQGRVRGRLLQVEEAEVVVADAETNLSLDQHSSE